MAAWDGGISLINYAYPKSPKIVQWVFGGTLAGAATTIVGEFHFFHPMAPLEIRNNYPYNT